jgi:hypothetical protein
MVDGARFMDFRCVAQSLRYSLRSSRSWPLTGVVPPPKPAKIGP